MNGSERVRVAVFVSGVVQGVGFRPFVRALATELGLAGFVRNEGGSVYVELEGPSAAVFSGCERVRDEAPPLARVQAVHWEQRQVLGHCEFRIEQSSWIESSEVAISADVATCEECLREIFDPRERRYRYAFTNCTQCGPRLSIVTGAPYDRERTTMAQFPICDVCRREYDDPTNRRFHAQPIACPSCGPELWLCDGAGKRLESDDAIRNCAERLRSGAVVAIKGLGGYHLACDARNEDAVAELRRRKRRDQKPFALMVSDVAAARAACMISDEELAALVDRARPIVLLARRPSADIAPAVAPGLAWLGVMLPYTPLHHLLFAEHPGLPLVMTSGNLSDEPIAFEDGDALERLSGIADFFLMHNRPIRMRCDDSVVRRVGRCVVPLRRARGYAPEAVCLPQPVARPALALGGELKNTFALASGTSAVVSAHVGDLDEWSAYLSYLDGIEQYRRLFEIDPVCVVHDLHPDYASTRHALEWERRGLQRLAVQHHHAHMAACMAEHGLTGKVIGVVFDGMGFGLDGSAWGGEFLVGDASRFERSAHLLPVALPGGDRAAREPWRMAAAHLLAAGVDPRSTPLGGRIERRALELVLRMVERGINSPPTTSAGRLFDAVASLAGVADYAAFEASAAIELESLAARTAERKEGSYPFCVNEVGERWVVDTRPLILAVAADAKERVAWRFHATLADIVASVCARLAASHHTDRVVLSGGVFQNAVLSELTVSRLEASGLRAHTHRVLPPNDACLSLGQLAILASLHS